jgi:2-oxoglutarate ferredoxin oxidoreductase subunit alpha
MWHNALAPATGFPTRTEQADLNLVLYAGHGEFPRIILAPGNPGDAFELGALAFDWADKFQVPVFVLSDQYLIDSTFVSDKFKVKRGSAKNYFVKTQEGYKRYALSDKPFSPRGIPNFGDGLVCVDSDEHDEEGCISENLDLRTIMVQKRLGKLDEIKTRLLTPELFGAQNYKFLIVGWGSNYGVIKEVIKTFEDTAFLYFKQVYPLHPSVKQFMQKAEKTVVVENNATAQFANLIRLETGEEFDFKVLKYNGMPFSTEELQTKLKEVIG